MVEKAKKIIAENGFKVKMVETADVMYTYFFLNTLVISLKHHCISHGEVYSVKYTLNMVYNGHREMGLVLAVKFPPKKTSPGR